MSEPNKIPEGGVGSMSAPSPKPAPVAGGVAEALNAFVSQTDDILSDQSAGEPAAGASVAKAPPQAGVITVPAPTAVRMGPPNVLPSAGNPPDAPEAIEPKGEKPKESEAPISVAGVTEPTVPVPAIAISGSVKASPKTRLAAPEGDGWPGAHAPRFLDLEDTPKIHPELFKKLEVHKSPPNAQSWLDRVHVTVYSAALASGDPDVADWIKEVEAEVRLKPVPSMGTRQVFTELGVALRLAGIPLEASVPDLPEFIEDQNSVPLRENMETIRTHLARVLSLLCSKERNIPAKELDPHNQPVRQQVEAVLIGGPGLRMGPQNSSGAQETAEDYMFPQTTHTPDGSVVSDSVWGRRRGLALPYVAHGVVCENTMADDADLSYMMAEAKDNVVKLGNADVDKSHPKRPKSPFTKVEQLGSDVRQKCADARREVESLSIGGPASRAEAGGSSGNEENCPLGDLKSFAERQKLFFLGPREQPRFGQKGSSWRMQGIILAIWIPTSNDLAEPGQGNKEVGFADRRLPEGVDSLYKFRMSP